MNDGFPVRVLHALAHLDKEFNALPDVQFFLVAIFGDR